MHFDVIVIGTGQAGAPLAARLAEAGRNVLIVEASHLGGTCVNYGCTPTKTMIASARAAHVARTADRLGVHTGDVRVDLNAVVDRRERIVGEWRQSVRTRLARAGDDLTLLEGTARFTGAREIAVNGATHTGDVVVVNVGARAASRGIVGLDEVDWLDNEGILELRELPPHLLVLGGGYIGCEFGQMFRRFGAQVTVIERAGHILSREDPEIAESLQDVFIDEGIDLVTGVTATSVRSDDDSIVVELDDGRSVRGTHLLVALGRRPNTDRLGTEAAGIELDENGYIAVDDGYRTSADGVYAVGDVAGGPMFTHTSWDDHRRLYDLLTGRGSSGREGRVIPFSVFTDPQVARVGITEGEAREKGIGYEVASMPFSRVARAYELDEPAGFMKVLIDPETERILGAAIVGAEAGELIHIFAPLMQIDATARAIVDVQCAHPTFAEGVQSLVMQLDRYRLA